MTLSQVAAVFGESPLGFASALLIVGIIGGTAFDPVPPVRAEARGPYLVVEADFHVHTRFSDGFLSPTDVVIQAQRRGLDAIAVTEHNTVLPAFVSRWFSDLVDGPLVLVGEEVTTKRFHLIGVGLTHTVDWNQSVSDVIAAIQAQGGVSIAAHPVERYWQTYDPVIDQLDAAEFMHPVAYGSRRGEWTWEAMVEFAERAEAAGHPLTKIGSSDYHFFSPLGICRTLVFVEPDPETSRGFSAAGILDALRAGRTVVFDLENQAHGDPEMIALLDVEPYPQTDWDYNYGGLHTGDRVIRTLGFAGLVGVLLLGPRRRRT